MLLVPQKSSSLQAAFYEAHLVGLDATENVLAAPEAELPSVEEIKLPTLVEKVALIPDKEFCIRIYCYWPPKKEDCQQWYCSECVWCPKKSSSLQAASSEAHFIGLAATEEVLADTWPGDPTRTPLILKLDADLKPIPNEFSSRLMAIPSVPT